MLIEIILSVMLGILLGTITGLIPGIHINLIGIFLISLISTFISNEFQIYFVVFIVAMAITHTFLDFIPSIFLGCPDTDTELSILPGHELLKKGEGYQAIILTAYGSLAAIFMLLIIAFPLGFLINKTYHFIKEIIPFLLIAVSVILISLEKKKLTAIFVFLITGILGFFVLNSPHINQPLLPLLTGLFGGSMLIISIKNKTQIEKQKISEPKVKIFKPLLGALVASPLCSFLPGLGSGQAAIIGNIISKTDRKGFLILLGATNTLVMGFSFITLYLLGKTRTGAAVAIKEILPQMQQTHLILILITILFTGIISFFLTKTLAKFFAQKISLFGERYSDISKLILIILIIVILNISKFSGFFVFILATLLGMFCISLKVRRTNMMGCLLIPVILFYFGF